MTMADTVAVMNKGKIEQMGPPQALYELPKTAFVATFLGQSNLFTGEVVSSNPDSITIESQGARIVVPKDRAERHSGTVTVGVRPEKVTLSSSEPSASAGTNILGPGRVTDVSFSGVSTQYEIAMPGHATITVFEQNTSISRMHHDGDEVWLSWAAEHTFGLADEGDAEHAAPRFVDDTPTTSIATRRRAQLKAELEEG